MTKWTPFLLLFLPASRMDCASVVTVPLPPPSEITEPIAIPVGQKASLEIDLPYPLADWVGKGFTPDPSKYKGSFAIEAARGQARLYLTAQAANEHALLHLTLEGPSGTLLSYPLEVIAAPEPLAWTQVTFTPSVAPVSRQAVSFHLPSEPSTPERELALLHLTRLLGELPQALAEKAATDSKLLWCAHPAPRPEDFGPFSVSLLRVVQDRDTADLAFEARIDNATAERLWLDPYSWALRNGDRLYPVRTVDFTGTIEPHGTATIAGVIACSETDLPPYIDLEALTLLSARLASSSTPRPVQSYDVPILKRR